MSWIFKSRNLRFPQTNKNLRYKRNGDFFIFKASNIHRYDKDIVEFMYPRKITENLFRPAIKIELEKEF